MSAADGPTWSDIAVWYDELVQAGSGPHETAVDCLLRLLPPLGRAEVLDLACGQGLATRAVATAGAARVVGVDSSERMVELARRHGVPEGCDVSYVVDDAHTLAAFETGAFDGVTCQLALMDIPDLDATMSSVHRVLRGDGWFAFVIGHPCFLVPDAETITRPDGRAAVAVTGYFEERFWRSANPTGVRRAGNHHRMVSTYLNALVRWGFAIEAVDEPRAGRLLTRQQPVYSEVPIFLACRARRGRR